MSKRGGEMQNNSIEIAVANRQELEKLLYDLLHDAKTSIMINDAVTGEKLFNYNSKIAMKPASTMKNLTAGAAFEYLGKDFRFNTEVLTTGKIINGVLEGDVYLKGGGDPTLNQAKLKSFAEALKLHGITRIKGRLYGDDYLFDQELLTPGIWKFDESEYYAAPISALTLSPTNDYDSGSCMIDIHATKIGKKPIIEILPDIGNMTIINKARTVKDKGSLTVERKYRTNEIIISGSIEVNDILRKWVTIQHPSIYTMALYKKELQSLNIALEHKKVRLKKTPKYAELRKQLKSEPLHQLVIPFMKLSNNGIADILIKMLGVAIYRQGTTVAGLRVLRSFLDHFEIDEETWKFEDGSGMSHNNGVVTASMNHYLYEIQRKSWFEQFMTALPVGGNKNRLIGGTLRERMNEAPLQSKFIGKTGSLSGVNTLAGYLETASKRRLIVSIYVQEAEGTIEEIDALVEWIYDNY